MNPQEEATPFLKANEMNPRPRKHNYRLIDGAAEDAWEAKRRERLFAAKAGRWMRVSAVQTLIIFVSVLYIALELS
tara:strand:+ start:1523 stop:1750 length:228 start_codon:yes stop_codon:yes gene_type:complete